MDGSKRHNIKILSELFGENVEKWYNEEFMTHLWYVSEPKIKFLHKPASLWDTSVFNTYPDVCYLHNAQQEGGGYINRYYQYISDNGTKYIAKIASLIATNKRAEIIGNIFLLSPTHKNKNISCVEVIILRSNPKVADISGVNNHYSCTNHGDPPSAGHIYIRMMLQFLKERADQLGITQVELSDCSSYKCPERPTVSIPLEFGRQLEGKDPYYMQFGFRPKSERSVIILANNRQKMSQLLTGDQILSDFCVKYGCTHKIKKYINEHKNQPMTETIKYISRHNCVFYGMVCHYLFKMIGLKELKNLTYVMKISEISEEHIFPKVTYVK
jgi:hypothetical protein